MKIELLSYLNEDYTEKEVMAAHKKQFKIYGALILRNILGRFGHDNIGFFWIIVEPMLLTLGVMLMWSLHKEGKFAQLGVVPFALTGYSFLTLWRHITGASVRFMSHNLDLLYHRKINFLDLLIAKALSDLCAILSSFTILYLIFYMSYLAPPIQDPLLLFGGLFYCFWISFSFGLVLCGLSEISEPMEHFIPPMLYLTLPFTGIFFMLDWFPSYYRYLLLYSPLINAIEMFRAGLLPDSFFFYWDYFYLNCYCIIATALGIILLKYSEYKVLIR